ncbi:MAG: hypothetical protein RI996_609 [Candidatus Parcubacteria bacterium]|jgi:hypothetical protein
MVTTNNTGYPYHQNKKCAPIDGTHYTQATQGTRGSHRITGTNFRN